MSDTLDQLNALDEQRDTLMAQLRAERVTLRERLEKLDALLGPTEPLKVARKPRAARKALKKGLPAPAAEAA